MKVFVTGASGFVGSHLVSVLLENGCDVSVLALPEDPLIRLRSQIDQINLIHGRLESIASLESQLARLNPDVCFHLAWNVEPGAYLESSQNIRDLFNSLQLLDALIKVNCQQIIMTGTCAEYDTGLGYLSETSPTKPATLYAAAKLSLATLAEQIAKQAQIHFAWARLFYLYGDSEDPRRVVPALINSLLHSQVFPASPGEQVRDYLHVDDVAAALWFIAQQRLSGIYNVCSGDPVTVRRLMETVGEILERKDLIQFGSIASRKWEPAFICGDNRKLRGLGWSPRIPLREGLERTIHWWQNA